VYGFACAHQYVNLPELRDRLLRAILLIHHLSTPSSKLNTTTFNPAQKKPVRSRRAGGQTQSDAVTADAGEHIVADKVGAKAIIFLR
jgi:hypothetical protein